MRAQMRSKDAAGAIVVLEEMISVKASAHPHCEYRPLADDAVGPSPPDAKSPAWRRK